MLWCLDVSRMKLVRDEAGLVLYWSQVTDTIQSTCQCLEFSRKLKKENVVSYFHSFFWIVALSWGLNWNIHPIFFIWHTTYICMANVCVAWYPVHFPPYCTPPFLEVYLDLPRSLQNGVGWSHHAGATWYGKKLFGFLSLEVTDQRLPSVFSHGYSKVAVLCCA